MGRGLEKDSAFGMGVEGEMKGIGEGCEGFEILAVLRRLPVERWDGWLCMVCGVCLF